MREGKTIPPYRWLAQYYDEVFAPFRTPIDAARKRVLGRILPKIKTACDLACGTGATALALAQRGISVYAVDVSPTMCRLTRKKAAGKDLPIRVSQADIRSFKLPRQVDLIICEGDALNHVPRRSDLRMVARAVAHALRPGGYFYFDVNNALGFERYWDGTVRIEKPNVELEMRNSHNRSLQKAWTDIDWLVRERNSWQRHQERVEEVCWSASEIQRALSDAGFEKLEAWDAAPFFKGNPMVKPGCRTLFLARKFSTT